MTEIIDVERLLDETFHDGSEATAFQPEKDDLCDEWEIRGLKDAYAEREPWKYIVDGLIPYPSLIAVYGGPGSLKSMIMADLCAAVASGDRWLPSLEGKLSAPGATFDVTQAPILWIDFDNGKRRTDERMDAVASARGLPVDAPFHYVSMPRPWLDISKISMVTSLAKLIKRLGAQFIVIDNLGLITGDTEENSAEMAQVMGNLRWLVDDTNTCVAVIHHQRKATVGGDKIRKGETLRGHSSIEAALDLALLIERSPGEDAVTGMLTKVRGYSEHVHFGALFTYDHRDDTHDLSSAKFFCRVVDSEAELENMIIESVILREIQKSPGLNKGDLVKKVQSSMAAEAGGKAPNTNKVRGLIEHLEEDQELTTQKGERNAILYYANK